MTPLQTFVREFIISEINKRGYIELNDEKNFTAELGEFYDNELFEITSQIPTQLNSKPNKELFLNSLLTILKKQKRTQKDADEREKLRQMIIIIRYHIYLHEKNLDLRYKKQIRELIKAEVLKNKSFKLLNERFIYKPSAVELTFVESIADFIKIRNDELSGFENIFYRGHSNFEWEAEPTIYRNDLWKHEHEMFREIIIRNPEEFQNSKSAFEKLTIMQHYGLPTRLLDITKNPLVALYFACSDQVNVNRVGELLVFTPNEKIIKYYDSDTVSIISNIAKAEREINPNLSIEEFNEDYIPGLKLLHLIKEEKPYFLSQINPEDLQKALIVRPINNNPRIKKQNGYFFIFGIGKEISEPASVNSLYVKKTRRRHYLIDASAKKKILNELEALGINSEILFPEIEKGAEYIKNKHKIFA